MGLTIEKTLELPLILEIKEEINPIDSKLLSIIEQALYKPPIGKSCVALGAKTLLAVCSIIGRVPYFPQMSRLANGNVPLSYFYKIMSLPVFSSDYIWSSIRMVNEIMIKNQSHSIDNSSKCHLIYKLAISILLGAIAQTPLIALAYKYNTQNPSMVALSATDTIMPIYSAYILISLWQKKDISEFAKKYLAKIEALETDIITKDSNELQFLIDKDLSSSEKTRKLEDLLTTMDIVEDAPIPNTWKPEILSAQISGLILTAFFLMWVGVFTYEGMEELINITALSGFSTALSILVNAGLMGTIFIETQKQLINSVFHRKDFKPSFITESLRPTTAIYLKIFSIVFVSFQAMAAIQISRDYCPSNFVIPSAVLLSITYAISAYFPFRQLTDWSLQECLLKCGTAREKDSIALFQKVEVIKELIKAS